MNFQSLLNFILSPFGVVIIFGVISTMARMFKSAQDQQAKKRAIHQQRLAQRDALRTGAKSSSASQQAIQTSTPLQTQTSKHASKKANWDQKQQIRRDRIEQMRQQRIEQLKKLRQKRSGTQSPQQTPAPRQQARVARPQPQPQQTAAAQAHTRPTSQPTRRTPPPQQQPTRRQPPPQPNRQPSRQTSRQTVASAQPVEPTRRRRPTESVTDSQIQLGSVSRKKSSNNSSIRAQFRKDIRRSIIAKEILGQPMGLRSPDSQTMGIM